MTTRDGLICCFASDTRFVITENKKTIVNTRLRNISWVYQPSLLEKVTFSIVFKKKLRCKTVTKNKICNCRVRVLTRHPKQGYF